ncbi:MAG: rnhA operon protein [Halobacteriales archaeon]
MANLPRDVVETAAAQTRRARRARDEKQAERHRERRAALLDGRGYSARVREEDTRDVLVLYPDEWLDDGTVRTDRIEDLDRAVEVVLSGAGDPDDWDAVDAHNRRVAERVRDRHGDVHGDNADALADFVGNHYAKPIEDATPEERAEFLAEYFPRNAWPDDRQREAVERSVELAVEAARALREEA